MSLVDYSDLEKEIKEAPEPVVLPKGTEVKARIISVKSGVSSTNQAKYYMPQFDIPDNVLVTEFNDFLWDLVDRHKLTPKQQARALRRFKVFAESFGIDYAKPFSWDELVGLEGWMIVGYKTDAEYGDKNTVSKYVAGSTPQARAQFAASQPDSSDDIPF